MSVAPLRVVVAHRPPLTFVDEADDSRPIFTGFLLDLLPTLLQQANVQNTYELEVFKGSGGTLLQNGSWTGVMRELVNNQTDIALFPLTITSLRAQYIKHTQAYMDDGYGILIQTKQIDSGYSFLLPFEPLTWVLLLLSLVAVMMIISVLDWVSRRARLKAIERAHGASKVKKVRKRDKLMGHAIETVMMAVGSGSTPTSRSCSVKVMFVAWAIFCVIMLSAYTASLTANLTVNQMAVTVKSLSDLAQFPLPFGVPAQSSVTAYFHNSSDKIAVSLRPKMLEYNAADEAVQAVRDGKLIAYINDYSTVQYYTQEPPCDLTLGTETIGSGSLVLGLAANSTLAPVLDRALLQLSEAGYLTELRRKWFVAASQCTADDSKAEGNGRLSISQAWSVFLILVVGAGVALIIAALEAIYYRRLFSGVQQLKQDLASVGPRQALKKRMSRRYNKSVGFSTSLTVTADLEDPEQLSICPTSCKDIDAVSFPDQHASPATTAASVGIPVMVNATLPPNPGLASGVSEGNVAAAAAAGSSDAGSHQCSGSSHASRVQQPKLTSEVLQQVEQQQQQQPTNGASFSAWYNVGRGSRRPPVVEQNVDPVGEGKQDVDSSSSSDEAVLPCKQ